jgi:hypothetical protein
MPMRNVRRAGTNTSWSSTSLESVPRMPIVSQQRATETSAAGRNAARVTGAPSTTSSGHTAVTHTQLASDTLDAKARRPDSRNPPSSSVASMGTGNETARSWSGPSR